MAKEGVRDLMASQKIYGTNEDLEEDEIAAVAAKERTSKITSSTFLDDSAASTHMGNSDEGMYDVKLISSPVKIGNGVTLTATKIGKRKMTAMQSDGTTVDVILEDYKYVPDLWVNLFSITKALSKGWNIGNKGIKLFVSKSNVTLTFDQVFRTQKGMVLGVAMLLRVDVGQAMATMALERGKTIKINELHEIMGHPSEDTIKKTAELYGWKVTGTFTPCEDLSLIHI